MRFESTSRYTRHPVSSICGLDEAGRGPWAGPLYAAAVIATKQIRFQGLNDSKLLTADKREKLYQKITAQCFYGIGKVTNKEIDRMGLNKAVNLSFNRALKHLAKKHPDLTPKILLIDGRDKLKLPYPYISIIKGDRKIKQISCASIIAKVERDREMEKKHHMYPQYHFHLHKGYGTQKHQEALKKHGACHLHRMSYRPLLPYISNVTD